MRPLIWLATAGAVTAASPATAQVAEHVADVDEGVVRFTYQVRDGVEICDQGIRVDGRRVRWRWRSADDDPISCRSGTAEAELEVRDGLVTRVEILRPRDERSVDAVEVGRVSAEEASRYLFSLAREGATARGARDAILPATLADVAEAWRDLEALSTDRSLSSDVRQSALFWLGQEAADAVTAGLTEVALDEDEDQEIRDAAIFALSQRPPDEGLPVLMELARGGDQVKTRRTAMFWLAQSGEERVVEFFREILVGSAR